MAVDEREVSLLLNRVGEQYLAASVAALSCAVLLDDSDQFQSTCIRSLSPSP